MSPGLNSLGLTTLIISSAKNASTHRNNCHHLAHHVNLIAKLLEKLRSSDMVTLPAIKEPLDGLDQSLNQALQLVESCRHKSFLYMLAMGWTIVHQFRQVQAEIDRHLMLLPLISLVHQYRMQNLEEGLQAIDQDEREYTLDEEDVEAQSVILRSVKDSKQCRVIEHLIDVTENVVTVLRGNNVHKRVNETTMVHSRNESNAKCSYANQCESQWQVDLFDCCSEPCLSLKTCMYPCGVFSSIINVVSKGNISRKQAISNLMAYSLICGGCCYSCYVRSKLRRHFNIEGGLCDDFITHLICCCCAMVQEWREIEARGS
ncbi:S-adenosyl-L-methionine-dependent methyltransferases superfamily protein isoform 1 [Hibiscus syriacus]|uniref:S-adenosyl-L-methionine-dependent methyltransferases superfamily protein isoform 1 n=1 Tax=Hibiscus syriacus TaxID=106335 RepID=A0A6A2XYH9_HIBSY|nr:S-adenosyl-L-methionine-dependent methyltransferases superfamily protein isoform 1 [Hibiscus syriacus]